MAESGFAAVIFDCDGVLVDSEILGLEASAAYLRGHGFDWSPADLVRLFTGFRDDVFAAKLTEAYRGLHGRDPDEWFFEGLIDERRSRRHLLQPVPGAHEAAAGVAQPKAVASSSRTEFLLGKLKRTGLYDLFAPHIYPGEVVAHGKPAPDIFLYAAERLGADPAASLVLEDSENGVKAGRAAGMTVWGFVGGGHCYEGHGERLLAAGAHALVSSFAEFSDKLDAG